MAEEAVSKPDGSWLRRFGFVAKLSLTVFALFLVSRLVDPDVLISRVRETNPWVIAAAVVLMILQIPLVAVRWRLIVSAMSGEGTVLPRMFEFQQITFLSQFFGQFLPFAAADGVRLLMLRAAGTSLRIAFKSTLLDRGFAVLALLLIALPAVLFSPILASAHAFLLPVLVFVAAGLAAAFVVLLLIDRLHGMGARWRIVGTVTEALVDMRDMLKGRRLGLAVMGLCFAVHGLSVFVFWLLAQGHGVAFGIGDAFGIVPLVLLVSMAPVAVGGWGLREGFVIALFAAAGIDAESALLLSLLFGTVVLAASIPGMVLLLFPSGRTSPVKTSDRC